MITICVHVRAHMYLLVHVWKTPGVLLYHIPLDTVSALTCQPANPSNSCLWHPEHCGYGYSHNYLWLLTWVLGIQTQGIMPAELSLSTTPKTNNYTFFFQT